MRRRSKVGPVAPSEAIPPVDAHVRWASETGAHGMPVPQELERLGWHRLAEHPLLRGTWLMETAEEQQAVNHRPSKAQGSKLKVIGGSRGSR